MGFGHGAKIVQNGLVMHLDPFNTAKSAKGYDTNLLDLSQWTVGSGSSGTFNKNGAEEENERIIDSGPHGKDICVWQSPSNDEGSNSDGGWDTSRFVSDCTKMHRFTVWTRKKDVMGNGRFYLGTFGFNSFNANIGVRKRASDTNTTNFYFHAPRFDNDVSGLIDLEEWVLSVGHAWPAGSGAGAFHSDSGIWNLSGERIYLGGDTDCIWEHGTEKITHRSYQYYSSTPTEVHQWAMPRVDIVDGTEPSIQDLIAGAGAKLYDISGNGNDAWQIGSYTHGKYSDGKFIHAPGDAFFGAPDGVTTSSLDNGAYWEVETDSSLDPALHNEWTVCGWLNLTGVNSSNGTGWFHKAGDTDERGIMIEPISRNMRITDTVSYSELNSGVSAYHNTMAYYSFVCTMSTG